MLKVGYLVPVTVVKALPDYDSYLTLISGTELLALLPKKYTSKSHRVGDNLLASVFMIRGMRIVLSQKSPQFLRRLAEHLFSPIIQNGSIRVRRAASISTCRFVKIAVESLNGVDPVKECLPYIHEFKQYIEDTVTIVRYSPDMEQYIINALVPAPPERVKKVIYYKTSREAHVYVDGGYLGLFLGKGGMNVATASKLTNTSIMVFK